MWNDYSNDPWRFLHLYNVAGVFLWCISLGVYVLLQGIGHVCSRTYREFPALLQGSDITAFQAGVLTAESCLNLSVRFTMDVSETCLFLMHVEIIGISTCTSLGGKSVVSFIKWTILLYSRIRKVSQLVALSLTYKQLIETLSRFFLPSSPVQLCSLSAVVFTLT